MGKQISESYISSSRIVKVNISLSGLSCMSCIHSIESALQRLQGVIVPSIHADLPTSNVILEFDESIINIGQIKKAIQDAGYHVVDIVEEESYMKTINKNMTKNSPSKTQGNDTTILAIGGMTCASCVKTIQSAVEFLPGVTSVNINLLTTQASIKHDQNLVGPRDLIAKIEELGYEPQLYSDNDGDDTTILEIGGMTCASCVQTIQSAVELLPGVASVNINLLTTQASIKHDRNLIGPRDLITKIEELGYEPQLYTKGPSNNNGNSIRQRAEKEQKKKMKGFLISLIFAVPTFFITMIFMMALPESNSIRMGLEYQIIPGLEVNTLILFIFATPVQFILGYPFYIKGIRSIWYSHQANMDTLVAVGTTVAYVGSLLNVLIPIVQMSSNPGQQFFETSIFLITFIYLGRWLEARAKGKTFETITKLMELQPENATLLTITLDEKKNEIIDEREIGLELVQIGDILKVNAGARIPCDGKIFRGTASLEESMLTGESIPVTKHEGDDVIAATINLSSSIWIKATRVGSDTTISRIIDLVQQAQSGKKAPIESLADKIAQVFVPVVISIAILDFILWISLSATGHIPTDWLPEGENPVIFSLFFAISVMVIACPCAMGLASPTAIMVGTGVAANHGILIKGGGEAIETAFRLDTIAFDKTGTLTYGKPQVVGSDFLCEKQNFNLESEDSQNDLLLLKIISLIESSSDHPLSKAITQYANEILLKSKRIPTTHVTLDSVKEITGKGLETIVTIHCTVPTVYDVFIGNEEWLKENGCVYPPYVDQEIANKTLLDWKKLGYSIVLIGLSPHFSDKSQRIDPGYILVQLGIADTPRPDAAKTIKLLKSHGIQVWMITGDNQITAKAIASKLGIENFFAQITPERKAEKIKWLQQHGRTTVYHNKHFNFFSSIKNMFQKNGVPHDIETVISKRATVAMIGDGINDSPALAQSDLPISIANATDVAIESSSVILTRATLTSLITLLLLSRKIIWRIRLNFLWAYIYNSLAIPIAAGALFPLTKFGMRPEMASLAMVCSSVSVVLSSLMLKRFKEPKY
ncbi:7905_t:CDS:2 [Dentiscutata erythropus]|uniref:P-type Cu(+) transporter n=1 Tax=Dentiscutata erythropus TaxID=1348616 RepID=A0A9N9NEV7_9GLOM|nr:7905_t:CDS:2 [Dentiscutata erythropus]